MTKLEYVYRRVRKCDLFLHALLFEHGDDEHLKGATEASASLLWHLEQLVKPKVSCDETEVERSVG